MTKSLFHLRQFRLLLLVLLCALFSLPLSAESAYVVQSTDQHTLTFYYDNNRKGRSGKTWDIDEKKNKHIGNNEEVPAWAGTYDSPNSVVTKVVFDASFKDFRPTTTSYWFSYLKALTTIEGLQNLNTSAVTDMSAMFSGCYRLKELNLSNFNTSKVTSMRSMFFSCSGLTSLNVSNFNTSKVTDMSGMFCYCFSLKRIFNTNTWQSVYSLNMFSGCTQLKGAVKYDDSKVDATMANLETGYFTDPNRKEAYVLQSEDQYTLTFYYDNNRYSRSSKTWDIDEKKKKYKNIDNNSEEVPVWAGIYESFNNVVTKVVFDASFKDFRPTTTEGWFYKLSALTTIEGLENLNTSKVTNMSSMFYDCSSLTKLNVSNFYTSKVTSMRSMFFSCSSLTSLYLSNFNTSAVTNMSNMFSWCSSLKRIFNTKTWRCEESEDMFKGCNRLKGTVKYNERKLDVTMANPETGYFSDPNKTYLEAYVVQSKDKETLTFYYDDDREERSGKTWGIDEKKKYIDNNEEVPAWTGTYETPNNVVTKVVFDASFNDFRPTTTKLWFSDFKALTTIQGLGNLNTSAVTDMSQMFYGCYRLKELNLSNFNTSAVTDMRWMFYNCSSLKELNVSNFNTSKVTDMSWMFCYCFSLKRIFNTQTWRFVLSEDMFKGCTQLNGAVKFDGNKLDVTMANPETGYFSNPNKKYLEAYVQQSTDQHTLTFYYDNNREERSGKTWDIDEKSSSSEPAWAGTFPTYNKAVTKVVFDASFKDFRPTITYSWFSHLEALTTIEGLENLNTSAVKNMSAMFSGCSGLTSLNVSKFNTSAVTDMRGMFSGCSGLTSLNVSNFNTSAVRDMSYMFSGCSGLTSLNVSNFNTSAVAYMDEMFRDCSGLKTILNPNTWRCEQSQDMFKGCTQLKGAVKYDASKVDATMANPTTGYFTDPNKKHLEAYVLQSEDQHTLTFYYDNNRKLRSGKTWDIDEKSSDSKPAWAGKYSTANKSVTKVVFDASFKDFRPTTTEGWFFNLSALTTIEGIENLNTSAVTDMREMFSHCSGLKELNVSNFNTARVTNMDVMFKNCSGLTALNVSNFNTSAVTYMGSMFYGCSGLKELNVSNFNTSAVTDMGSMFSGCSGLKELNVSNFNTSKVTTMYEMFYGCSSLTYLNLSNFNTSKVTDMRYMFSGCSRLTSLNLSNFNTSAVTSMPSMFYGCYGLKELNISNFNTSAVKNMSAMFANCWSLKELNVSNFNTSKVTDMSGMFSGCSSLKELNVSNFNTSAVTDMSLMFSYCSGLKTIINTQTWRCEKSQDMFKGCTQLKGAVKYDESKLDVTMANPTTGYFTDSNRKVEAYVLQSEDQHTLTFYYDNNRKLRSGKTWDMDEKSSSSKPVWAGTYSTSNKAVTKVVFDASFKDFRPTTTEGWFYHLSELATIEGLENLNTSAVTDMSAMFFRCSSLTELNVSDFNTSAVTDMSVMFSGCSGLKELNVSNFNTSKVKNMRSMFSYCSSLPSLNISNFNTSKVTDMGVMFSGCSGLKELNVSNFNTSAVTDMGDMFSGCSGLTSLNVSNFNTSAVADMSNMFKNCSGLKELNVSNFNTSNVTDMSEMFRDCSGLKTIINTQTWRCEKSQDMFNGCAQLNGAVKYDASKLDVTMANPTTGYFTDPNKKHLEAYVQQSKDKHTLTFFYDVNRTLRSGKTWDIDEQQNASEDGTEKIPAWASLNPNLETTKVVFDASFRNFLPTTTKAWFSSLQNLSTIEGIENLNTSAVTDMSGMFIGCSSLKELNVSNFNTSEVTSMHEMFRGCSSLKELNVSNFNTSEVTSMHEMFRGCSGLTSLNVSNFNTSAVTDMSYMFSGCSSLKRIFNTNTWRIVNSLYMFSGCTQLRGAVKYDESKVGATMANFETGYFTDPNRNEAYVLQSEDQHTLTFFYDVNRTLRSGKTWDIDEKSSSSKPVWAGTNKDPNKVVTKIVFDASFKDFRPTTTAGWFYHLSELTTIEGLENLNTSAVTDMYAMFFRCSSLMSLNLSNFNTSAVTNMNQMFYNCSGLMSLNLSNFNTSAVTNMNQMFYNCSSLMSLNLSNFNTTKVTNMSAMFYRCSGLKELNISNFNTSAVTDMIGMFLACSGLKELNVSNFNTSKVTYMGLMFSGCTGLKELNVSNFNTSAVTSMYEMFRDCSGLTELNISNFNTSAVTNMGSMFSGCSGLKTILNPNTWRCEKSQDMFKGCTQLKGAVKYDESKVDATMANPTTGYFSQKLPSAIWRVVFDDNNATQIYNLQGKRVNANQRHLPAGVYIVNGKKVYLNEKP